MVAAVQCVRMGTGECIQTRKVIYAADRYLFLVFTEEDDVASPHAGKSIKP